MRNVNTDVIVVGAGPAGSMAASVLAHNGFSVRVLERKKKVGFPNHCGEGLSRQGLEEAGFLGNEPWICHRVKGARIIFPNGKYILFTEDGYSIDRPRFDQALAERALINGAILELDRDVKRIVRLDNGWEVETKKGETFKAGYLVGAGGARCPVSNFFNQRPFLLPAFQYKFNNSESKFKEDFKGEWLDFYHCAAFPGSYGWAFPRGDHMAIGAGSVGDLKVQLSRLCEKLGYDPQSAIKREGGPIPFLKRPMRIVFPRALLTGDSGGFIYPLTKGGIHGAVWSGKLAGKIVSKALKTGEPDVLNEYFDWVHPHPSRHKRHLRVPQAFFNLNDTMFNGIGNIMHQREYDSVAVTGLIREILKRPSLSLVKGIGMAGLIHYSFKKTKHFAW